MRDTLHYLLMANYLTIQKSLLADIKNTELTPGQPKVLEYLTDHDGTMQRKIAAVCHIDPATITAILTGMERKNLIERKKQEGNRRSSYIYLTEKGREHAQYVADAFEKIEETALAGFTDSEKVRLNDFLTRIYQNIHAENGVGLDAEP